MDKQAKELMESKKDSNEKQNLKKLIMGLPKELKPKFIALKRISDQRDELEKQLQKEIEELEKKYDKIYEPINNKRSEIITGIRDPTEEVSSLLKDYEEEAGKKESNDDSEGKIDVKSLQGSKGIPEFWLKAMLNTKHISKSIKEIDKPILKYLVDIKSESIENTGFILKFIFAKNEYFNNETLVKTFIMDKNNSDELNEAIGTEINWADGKNITIKKTVKKQKNTKTNKTRKVEKIVDVDCFFQFFKTRIVPSEEKQKDMEEDEVQKEIDAIEDDLDLGEEISEKLIPHALNYYCGIVDEEGEEDFDDSDDLSEDSSDDNKNKVESKKVQNKKNIEWIPKAKETKKEETFKPLFDMKPAASTLFSTEDKSKGDSNAKITTNTSLFGPKPDTQGLFKDEIKKNVEPKLFEKLTAPLFGIQPPPQAESLKEQEKNNPIIDKTLTNQIPPDNKASITNTQSQEDQKLGKKSENINNVEKDINDKIEKSVIKKVENKELIVQSKEVNIEIKAEPIALPIKSENSNEIKSLDTKINASTEVKIQEISEANQPKDILNKAPIEDNKEKQESKIKENNLNTQNETQENLCQYLKEKEDAIKKPSEDKQNLPQPDEDKKELKKESIIDTKVVEKVDKTQEGIQDKNANLLSNPSQENSTKVENEQKLSIESKGEVQKSLPEKEPTSSQNIEKNEENQKEVKKEIKCGAQ